ncbi:hypothetical protein QLS91_09680 [Flavobacterium sp. LB2P84]|uniref:hypothetical protein n=1 Tax=Flavobacterium yafengii TaxID=3041253 RepID=UPI0024A98D7C|nr:hypothetical protein [Flavobacterium yafengii]MDI6033342.1 hypothetical protein [Flavobacterium yafengii]
MKDEEITLLISIILAIAGIVQVFALFTQNRQARLLLVNDYRMRWYEYRENWGHIVFLGRDTDEYYQVVNENSLKLLNKIVQESRSDIPTIWARESIQNICGIMSEVCLRILQGQLKVSDAYPIFGTELLRQSLPLRKLLESEYNSFSREYLEVKHSNIRKELQDWLVYHDGIRRRCLILIDLLWAEATRLEDLPPSDIRSAADSKLKNGKLNRNRVFKEVIRLSSFGKISHAIKLYYFLYHAEYKSIYNWIGIRKRELDRLESEWTKRLLINYN